jgi:site-specific recombinase XerD
MASPFLDYVREFMVSRRYAKRTVDTYVYWIRFYILFHHKRHPNQLSDAEVEQLLSYLVNQRTVAVKTLATALNALSFLYRHIILRPLSLNLNFNKAPVPLKLPVVLTRVEAQQLLAQLLYGSGLRLMEAVRLRVKVIDFDYLSVLVWQGKDNKKGVLPSASTPYPSLTGCLSWHSTSRASNNNHQAAALLHLS